MRLEFFRDTVANPVVANASRVVVCNNDGHPLIVAFETQPGQYTVAHYRDSSFSQVLKAMGVDKTELQVSKIVVPDRLILS